MVWVHLGVPLQLVVLELFVSQLSAPFSIGTGMKRSVSLNPFSQPSLQFSSLVNDNFLFGRR